MEDIQTATAEMRDTVEEIVRQVEAMPRDCIHWKPGPEVWTVMDNLCHAVEFMPYWTSQVEQAILHPEEEWGRTHGDAARLAAVADTSQRNLGEVKQQLRERVRECAARLERFTPEQFAIEARSRNPRWGVQPASFIVDTLLVAHLKSHCSQIRRNLAQYNERRQAGRAEGELS
jgi:hypothetical protein